MRIEVIVPSESNKWYLYRHCLPEREGMLRAAESWQAMLAQFFCPNLWTRSWMVLSSYSVHVLLAFIIAYLTSTTNMKR